MFIFGRNVVEEIQGLEIWLIKVFFKVEILLRVKRIGFRVRKFKIKFWFFQYNFGNYIEFVLLFVKEIV